MFPPKKIRRFALNLVMGCQIILKVSEFSVNLDPLIQSIPGARSAHCVHAILTLCPDGYGRDRQEERNSLGVNKYPKSHSAKAC